MTSNKIQFFFEDTSFELNNTTLLSDWILDVANQEKKELSFVNYILCSDNYLLELNRSHLNHDYFTDVISFPYSQSPIEGDVFISIDRVKENAATNNCTLKQELQRVMVHGLLHFIGYNDKTEEDSKEMRAMEDKYLDQFSL